MSAVSKFLLEKDMNAALVAFGCIMLSFIGVPGEIFASVIIAFITLRKGFKSGALVLAFVALPAVGFLLHKQTSPFDVMFLQCVFVWALAGLFKRYNSWRLNFEVMVVAGVIMLMVFHLVVPDTAQFWMNLLLGFVKNLNANANANINIADVAKQLRPFAPYLTGLLLFSMSSILFLELLVARRWDLRLSGKQEQFTGEFVNIHMGYFGAALLSLALIGVIVHMEVARDCLFVLALPFMFSGLSYIHYMVKRNRRLIYMLVLLYVGLFVTFTSLKVILLLVLIGYVDSLYDFRKRLAF
jgi:hypothetical protein